MAAVDDNTTNIPYLTGEDTFLDWVNHYNNYSVEKLNNLKIYSGFSGDGIDVVIGTTGSMHVNLADVITKGVTFSGDVTINGDLTYDWANALLGAVKHRVLPQGGYTAVNAGFTVGQPVRITEVSGDTEYYLARADSKDFAEVVGVISSKGLGSSPYTVTDTYLEITTQGIVQGDFTNINSSGAGLSAGCVYFLSPGASGELTSIEPSISGQISKPVLMGITSDKGIMLNYRGQYLQGTGTGGTGGIDNNKKIISLGGDAGSGLTAGYCVGWSGRNDYQGWEVLTSSGADLAKKLVGLCTTTEFDLAGNYYAEIITTGFIDNIPGVTESGKQWIGTDGLPTAFDMGSSVPSIGIAWPHPSTSGFQGMLGGTDVGGVGAMGHSVLADGVTYGTAINDNLLINGAFDIWQRSIGVDSVYGSTGSTHFADRWVRVDGTTGSTYGTHSIQRKTFATNQTEVFGNPKYYATLQNTMSGGITAEYIHIENRIEDVRTLRNEEATLSFWAKAGSSGMTMGIAVTQYSGVTASTTYPTSVGLGTLWSFYEAVIDVPTFTGTPSAGDYLGVGFRTNDITSTYDIAKVKLERGNISTTNADSNETEELNKCKRYYQRTYDLGERTHSITMLDNNTPSISSMNFTITPEKDTYHTFDIPMRTNPSLTLYSPSSGYTGDGFNRTANKDLRNTSGTYGWDNLPRLSPAGGSMIGVDYSNEKGMYITVPSGVVVFDNVSLHYVADSDLNENM